MSEYLIIRILILIAAIRSIRSIDIFDYEGETNVLETFGFTKKIEYNKFIRFQKSYARKYYPPNQKSELKSFAFEKFTEHWLNNFKIGINGNNELQFEMVSENFNNTITRETILPNQWNKLIVFYKNGDLEYWLNCGQHNEFSFYPPNNLKTSYYVYNTLIFPFSVGLFDVRDNITLLDIGGNFDIKRMKFYSGYLRPYENDCSDIP